jgi:hypothetical protein
MADDRQPAAPVMNRSRSQVATAYAPGAFFTFEGGRGACMALPDDNPAPAQIPDTAKNQIQARLNEIARSWFDRASNCRPNPPHPRLCLDDALLRLGSAQVEGLSLDKLAFVNPIRMGYAPAPLTFVCNHCGSFRRFASVDQLTKQLPSMQHQKCSSPKRSGNCQWRQLDVIFVHWSGNWEAATPGRWEWNDLEKKSVLKDWCQNCGSRDFFLNTESPAIGQWHFKCAKCGAVPSETWLQNDRFTTEVLGASPHAPGERRMEPISYRASSAFYPQTDQFIIFEEGSKLLPLLDAVHRSELENFIATQFGFGSTRPSVPEMEELLRQAGQSAKWDGYVAKQKLRDGAKATAAKADGKSRDQMMEFAAEFDRDMVRMVDQWFADGTLVEMNELPVAVRTNIGQRSEFSARYDPFTLAVEHEALKQNRLIRAPTSGGRRPFVRFDALDAHLSPESPDEKARLERETRQRMNQLGMEDFGLVREFDLCRFTYGYTRMRAEPFFEKRNMQMPVRLRLFPWLSNNRKPIYAVAQANEALYVRLNAVQVYRWLQRIGLDDAFSWRPGDKELLGAHLLERAAPFGRFLSHLQKDGPASSYLYVYTLLHTYAHVLMKGVAEHSGLDLSSLGEYLFPADLAFVVYRNGTTMDLGNLSSLWRNIGYRFLDYLLEPRTLLCNSGSTCDQFSYGACPDCIMTPETSCIASNQLLSRAVMSGGEPPREDGKHRGQRIAGFLEVVNEREGA